MKSCINERALPFDKQNMNTYIQQKQRNMNDWQQRQENTTLTIQSKREAEKAQHNKSMLKKFTRKPKQSLQTHRIQ